MYMKIFLNDIFNKLDLTFLLIFILFFLVFYFGIKLCRKFNILPSYSINYNSIQKSHEGSVPRLGGLIVLIYLLCQSIFSQFNYDLTGLDTIFICLIPLLFVTLIEDLFFNVHYSLRLIFSALSIFLLMILYFDNLPHVQGIPLISSLFENQVFSFVFFSLCLLVFINGCNFIDGMNGLLPFTLVGICLSFLYLSFLSNDKVMSSQIILYLSAIILFIVFNFPFGKIFLGDLGAYLFSALIGIWSIEFFAHYESFSSWNVLLILFYPTFEVIFSFVRKTNIGLSPFKPDNKHLHMLIYSYFLKNTNSITANNLTTLSLLYFIILPLLLLPYVMYSHLYLFFTIIFLMFSYLFLYLLMFRIYKNDHK